MDHAIGRRPEAPYLQVTVTGRTAPGGPTGTLAGALAGGQRGEDCDRALDEALALGPGLLHKALQRGQCLGRLHPVIAYPLAALRTPMLPQASDNRLDMHRFPLHPRARVGPIMIGDPLSLVALNAPERDRRTHDIRGAIGR